MYLLSFTPVGIVCSAVGRSEVEITCEGIEPSVLLQCSFSGGPLHPCEIIHCVNCVLIVWMVSGACYIGKRQLIASSNVTNYSSNLFTASNWKNASSVSDSLSL